MPNFNVYERVTARIIEQLEKGVIPWRKPWRPAVMAGSGKVDLRTVAWNRFTKTVYSPLNQMLLSKPGEYATFSQWVSIGGKIRKGSKSGMICFWKVLPVKEKKEDGTEELKQVPFLKTYNVFHIDDVEGVEPLPVEELKPEEPEKTLQAADAVIDTYTKREGIRIEYGGNRACYSPITDSIRLPERGQFAHLQEFYSTAFHELTHSTLTASRCDRREAMGNGFGSELYSREELVAEIGASGMLSFLGIETPKTFTNSAAYIQSWLKVLRDDVKMIVSASSKAEKAIDFILNGKATETAA